MIVVASNSRIPSKIASDDFEGLIYFVQTEIDGIGMGPIKIGFTAQEDVRFRIRNLQTACPWPLRLLGTVKGRRLSEMELHSGLGNFRLRGEWFKCHPTVMLIVERALKLDWFDDARHEILWAAQRKLNEMSRYDDLRTMREAHWVAMVKPVRKHPAKSVTEIPNVMKLGRPAVGDRTMSPAERMRAYRARRAKPEA